MDQSKLETNACNLHGKTKYYRYFKEELTKLFDSLIMSLLLYGIKIWGEAFRNKYLDRISDRFFKRAFRFG